MPEQLGLDVLVKRQHAIRLQTDGLPSRDQMVKGGPRTFEHGMPKSIALNNHEKTTVLPGGGRAFIKTRKARV